MQLLKIYVHGVLKRDKFVMSSPALNWTLSSEVIVHVHDEFRIPLNESTICSAFIFGMSWRAWTDNGSRTAYAASPPN